MYPGKYGEKCRKEAEATSEEKTNIVFDKANKKRNTVACFEVGYVSSSLPIGAEFQDSAPPRFANHGRTLS